SRRRNTRFSRDWSSDVCSSNLAKGINLRQLDNTHIGISLDQVTGPSDVQDLLSIFAQGGEAPEYIDLRQGIESFAFPGTLARQKIGRASCSDSVSIACVAGLLR